MKNIFFPCNMSNFGEARNRRPQCWLHEEPKNMTTWSTLQRAECRQTRTKNQHQARAVEIPPLVEEVQRTAPDEVISDTTGQTVTEQNHNQECTLPRDETLYNASVQHSTHKPTPTPPHPPPPHPHHLHTHHLHTQPPPIAHSPPPTTHHPPTNHPPTNPPTHRPTHPHPHTPTPPTHTHTHKRSGAGTWATRRVSLSLATSAQNLYSRFPPRGSLFTRQHRHRELFPLYPRPPCAQCTSS